jgi:hypothetical protein
MKHLPLARLLLWLLIALFPPLLGQCGGAVEHGTETGNPPVVEQQKLHIVLRGTGIEVVGDAGAVSPGANVRVTNRATGESAESTGRADGSVTVIVPGALQDEYEVTVSNGSGSQTVRVAAETSAGGQALSCDQLVNSASAQLNALLATAPRDCTVDNDCVRLDTSLSCVSDCGRSIAVAGESAALPEFLRSLERLDPPVCDEFRSRQCPGPFALPCPAPQQITVSCQAEQCTLSSTPLP